MMNVGWSPSIVSERPMLTYKSQPSVKSRNNVKRGSYETERCVQNTGQVRRP